MCVGSFAPRGRGREQGDELDGSRLVAGRESQNESAMPAPVAESFRSDAGGRSLDVGGALVGTDFIAPQQS